MSNVKDKKAMMAEKMYDQNSKGGIGKSSKYSMNGHASSPSPKYHQVGQGGKSGGEPNSEADKHGSFKGKYHQAAGKLKEKMKNGHSKANQKGQASRESTGGNEGETMMLGKNEHNRS